MNRRRAFFLISLALTAVVGLVFIQIRNFEYVLYDDPDYVTSNFHVLEGITKSGFVWAFTTGHANNWHPITWLSHMLDAQLFGPGPKWPHLINLLFHSANTIILSHILRKMTGAVWKSAFVAALFALHPLHVESVAWISERKDVLSAFFFLLTIWAYVRFADEWKVKGDKQKRYYGMTLLLFCFGLMSKPMLVTLPFVLLLLDFWPLQRCGPASALKFDWASKQLLIEKIPFFILSAATSIITLVVQKKAREVLAHLPLGLRLENTLVSYVRYLAKTILPTNLSALYPHPEHWWWIVIVGAGALVLLLSIAAIWTMRSQPYFATGWFWFLGMLVPVIGIVQVGEQSMADRYTYLPLIGIFIVITWAATSLMERAHFPKISAGIIGVTILAACAFRTSDQLRYWHDSEALFSHAVAVTENNHSAYIDLGSALSAQGFEEKAIECFKRSLEINPAASDAHNSLGTSLAKQGKTDEAKGCFEKAIEINPHNADALNNLGVVFARLGNSEMAEKLFEQSIQSKSDYPDAYNNLGQVLAASGRTDEAINCFLTVLKIAPDFANVRNNLAVQLSREGKFEEAIPYYEQELKMNRDQPKVHLNLGTVLASLGRRNEAISQFKEALRLDPNLSEAKQQLSILNGDSGGK